MTITIFNPTLGTGSVDILGAAVPAGKVRKFTKCTAYNGTGATVPIKIYLVPQGESPSSTNCYVDYDLKDRETYTCPEVVGGALGVDGTIQINGPGVGFSAVASDTVAA
jgi:hypothetical protein